MANLKTLMKQTGNSSQRRFLSQSDMAIIKHDAAVLNSQENRCEVKREANRYVVVCGCGVVGCAVHGSFENRRT